MESGREGGVQAKCSILLLLNIELEVDVKNIFGQYLMMCHGTQLLLPATQEMQGEVL